MNKAAYKSSLCGLRIGLLLVLLLAVQFYIPAAALCLEADGEAAIEYYSGGGCSDAVAYSVAQTYTAKSNVIGNRPEQDHCGPCTDVPLVERASDNNVLAGNETEADIGLHSLPAYTLTSVLRYAEPDDEDSFRGPGEFGSSHPSLNNTVLTC